MKAESNSWGLGLLIMVVVTLGPASVCPEERPLAWPIEITTIRGTYGDARIDDNCDILIHSGVDLHAWAGTDIYPVRVPLILKADPSKQGSGWYIFDVESTGGGSPGRYKFAHVTRDTNPNTGDFWKVDDVIQDLDMPFCRVWDWGAAGWSWDDHLHFEIVADWNPDQPLNNPLWQNDEGYEYLPNVVSPGPRVEAIAFGVYTAPCCAGFSDNTYYGGLDEVTGQSAVVEPSGIELDVFAYATTQTDGSGGGGPVGVCILEMAVEEREDRPQSPPGTWQHRMDLRKGLPPTGGHLPSDDEADTVFSVERCQEQSASSPLIPNTRVSIEDRDSLWYVITNFDSYGYVDPAGHIGINNEADSTTLWLWFRVTDHIDTKVTQGPVRVDVKPGPAVPHVLLSAVAQSNGINLMWYGVTTREWVGFRLCRGLERDGPFTPIAASWMPCRNAEGGIRHFSYLDTDLDCPHTYFYRLQVNNSLGAWMPVGPVVSAAWSGSQSMPFPVVQARPNPFRGFTDITLAGEGGLPDKSSAKVFDLNGKSVWEAPLGRAENARGVRWCGVDSNGDRVAAGIYLCRMESPAFSKTVKLIRLR